MNILPEQEPHSPDRWTLVRDIAVLQAKLIVDGLRDLLLVPASLVAGIVSLVTQEDGRPGSQFYHLLSVGKQSERWINLFGALGNAPSDLEHIEPFPESDMDELVGKLESMVVNEENRDAVTRQARERLEKVMKVINRGRRTRGPQDESS